MKLTSQGFQNSGSQVSELEVGESEDFEGVLGFEFGLEDDLRVSDGDNGEYSVVMYLNYVNGGDWRGNGGQLLDGESEVEFEKIASITPLPEQHVYDLSIEGTRNFIANGIIAHNTATYFQYLALFNTSNANFTPIINNETINYSIIINLTIWDDTDTLIKVL